MIIRNILIPYEGSPLSKKALELGKEIARNFNANLELLTIIPMFYPMSEPSIYSGATMGDYGKIVKELKTRGEKEIKTVTEKCREEGVKAFYKVLEGDISYTILKYAKKNKTNLIIMGSRRMKGLAALKRLGSTARYVSEHSTCPVTIVH
ncbi:MAG TPA: universal stress protein [Nitrosopumilaceae archaeon]|jgi:nucleotide-binding universal stress UspA family protein|nr:universal stress protein [Nitrosopumilaceae archaeon]